MLSVNIQPTTLADDILYGTLIVNSADPDQMPPCVAFHMGLHCLTSRYLHVSRMKSVIVKY